MTAAAAVRIADQMARDHAAARVVCETPSVERPTYHRYDRDGRVVETCHVGRRLALSWLSAWRRQIDALTGRGL